MDSWIPLFDIFLTSPTPEMEVSQWFHNAFSASISSSNAPRLTTASFLSLLMKPSEAIVVDSSYSSHSSNSHTKRIMFIHTLPNLIQSRILYFLSLERKSFCPRELVKLAQCTLSWNDGIDFWVKRSARHLLDAVSDSNYGWISSFHFDPLKESLEDDFETVPNWLKEDVGLSDVVFPWLPISPDELTISKSSFDGCHENLLRSNNVEEDKVEELNESSEKIQMDCTTDVHLEDQILCMALNLRNQMLNFETGSKLVGLAEDIRKLCLYQGYDSFAVLTVIAPWQADDEAASVLVSHLVNGFDDEPIWPSRVLSSIILPKLLVLEEQASRILVSATINYCHVYQSAAEYALMFPLLLRREGINNPICDVMTNVIRECLHPAHVSAFCQKLLCGGKGERKIICPPCHLGLISNDLVWTESLFSLFQSILSHNVCLTQDSVDVIVYQVQHSAEKLSRSLKFGKFILCFITKCSLMLMSHKFSLIRAVECTDTLVTKSILSKLKSL